jgi:hypothetical protein
MNWLESGRILAKIFADKGYEPKKRAICVSMF